MLKESPAKGGVPLSQTRRLLLEYETEEVGKLAAKDARNRKALIKAFGDTSDVVRERALLAAIELADPTIVNDVLPAMDDDDDDVRIACAQVLSWYHQPKTIPHMIKGLTDSNTWVRSHCAAGLSKIVHGPIWARLPSETIELFMNDFSEFSEGQLREFLLGLGMLPEAIDSYLKWKTENFDIEIDVGMLVEEMERGPIILVEAEEGSEPAKIGEYPIPSVSMTKLPDDIDTILSELPDEVRLSLPPEDLVRLTPESARELVDSLQKPAAPKKKKKPKEKAKKKVRKVRKVRKVSEGPSRAELIEKIPKDVRESVGEDTLKTLKTDELLALIGPEGEEEVPESAEEEEEIVEPEEKKEKKKHRTPSEEIELSAEGPTQEDTEARLKLLTKKYGSEKAQLLVTIPENILAGIPEDQIEEMDMETLQGLTDALDTG
jgi:hypothetical protein